MYNEDNYGNQDSSNSDFGANFGSNYRAVPNGNFQEDTSVITNSERQTGQPGTVVAPPSVSVQSEPASVRDQLNAVKAEIGRLSVIERNLQQQLNDCSELRELKEALSQRDTRISELTTEKETLVAEMNAKQQELMQQLSDRGHEIDNLRTQLINKEEEIRARDDQLMEHGKKQSESDSHMAAVMDKISSQQKIMASREEEMHHDLAAKEKQFEARENELLAALHEWQRASQSKEEAIWHMQAAYANEKSNMEAHFLHQISKLVAEKHSLMEQLQKMQGGEISYEAGQGISNPWAAEAQSQAPGNGPSAGAPPAHWPGPASTPPAEEPPPAGGAGASQSLDPNPNWMQSLLAGGQGSQASGLGVQAWVQTAAPGAPESSSAAPAPEAGAPQNLKRPVSRLLADNELVDLLCKVLPHTPETARVWSPEDDMGFEELLYPFNWADHYGPQHGSVLDFLQANPEIFIRLGNGAFYCALPGSAPSELTAKPTADGGANAPRDQATVVVTPMPASSGNSSSSSSAPPPGSGSGRPNRGGGKGGVTVVPIRPKQPEARQSSRRGRGPQGGAQRRGVGSGPSAGSKPPSEGAGLPSSGQQAAQGVERGSRPLSYKAVANSASR